MESKAVFLNERDNIAVALRRLESGERCKIGQKEVEIAEQIPQYHKFAVREIHSGEDILKYGEKIGEASADIAAGRHVHVHNLKGTRG